MLINLWALVTFRKAEWGVVWTALRGSRGPLVLRVCVLRPCWTFLRQRNIANVLIARRAPLQQEENRLAETSMTAPARRSLAGKAEVGGAASERRSLSAKQAAEPRESGAWERPGVSAERAAERGEMSAFEIDFSDAPELTPEVFARAIVRLAAI